MKHRAPMNLSANRPRSLAAVRAGGPPLPPAAALAAAEFGGNGNPAGNAPEGRSAGGTHADLLVARIQQHGSMGTAQEPGAHHPPGVTYSRESKRLADGPAAALAHVSAALRPCRSRSS